MRIVHFHPDARMAARFIGPLMNAERVMGYQTELVFSVCNSEQEGICLPFDLSASNSLFTPWTLYKLWRYLKRRRPHVVFSHNTKSSLVPLLAAFLAGVRVRVYFNHGVPYVGYRGILGWLLRSIERGNIFYATQVVTVSKDMIGLLQSVSPRIQPQIIANGSASGVDLKVFPELSNRAECRRAHSWCDEDLVVAYVGRPERRKGFELVLRLWADHFHEKHIKLVLCGPSPDDVLKYLSSLPPNVICLGFTDNVPGVLSGADLMILPSRHEGLSYACMEAQAAGAVVLANDICGIRSVVEDETTGFLVPNNDATKYVELIRKIDKNRASIKAIQLQARKSVARFSRDTFIPCYLSFLRGLFSG
jgi:N,N'-diacetylbacillosaminyl-diphospho-undecaprenol alpha-1,3-N-acetylgalactosaminyltransferase